MPPNQAGINIEDNKTVVSLLKEGNEEVFDQVYRYYFRGLCAFCSQYIAASESEEIVQDTMMWLWESRALLIIDFSLKSLLFTIVKNKALNRISHQDVKRKVFQEITEKFEAEFASPDFYLGNELLTIYEAALKKLPAEFRQAYEMNRNRQLTHKEIAELLGVSPQTVNYRIGQALKILRVELKDYLPLLLIYLMRT